MGAAVVMGRTATMHLVPTATTVRAFTIGRASVDTSIHHEDGVCAALDGVGEAGGGVDGAVGSRRSLSPSPSRTRVDVEPATLSPLAGVPRRSPCSPGAEAAVVMLARRDAGPPGLAQCCGASLATPPALKI